jgi:rhodanese-related sulfurtransferase
MKTQNLKNLILLVLAFTMVFAVTMPGTSETETISTYKEVSVADAHELVYNETEVYILDVRTQAEWDDLGFIHGATLVPHTEILTTFTTAGDNASMAILVYCKAGTRGGYASENLTSLGYTNVMNMLGGITAWIEAGYFVDIVPEKFKANIKNEETFDLIDVRTQEEWDTGYLHGATLIVHDTILSNTDLLPTNKSELLLVYCKLGGRGSIASKTLEDLGYTNVKNLYGGITAWLEKGYFIDVPVAYAKDMIDNKKYDLLIDVRTQEEWDTGYIEGAILIVHDTILANTDLLPTNKSAVIIVYCKLGGRGSIAAQTLEDLGYVNVINIGGGITAWNASGYEIAGTSGTPSVNGFGYFTLVLSVAMIVIIRNRRK